MPMEEFEGAASLPVDCDTDGLKARYGFDTRAARAECLRLAGPLENSTVLDVGTGCGLMAAALVDIRAFVTSIDNDFETVVRTRDRLAVRAAGSAGNSRLLVADASHLPFASDIFDAVFCFDSMHHMTDCSAAAGEMERVVKPGGLLVIADLNPSGLTAVRSLNAERRESHEENACGLDDLSRILRSDGAPMDRHDYDFLSVFVKQEPKPTLPTASAPLAAQASSVLIDVEEGARQSG